MVKIKSVLFSLHLWVCHNGYGIKIRESDNVSEYFKRRQLHLYATTHNYSPELILVFLAS